MSVTIFFSFYGKKFGEGVTRYESHPPSLRTVYFPTAPSFSVETVISQPLLTFRHYCTQVSKQSIVIMQSCMHLYLVFPQSTVYTLISSTVSSAGFVLFSSIHNTSRTFIHIILVPNHFRHISCLFYYFS